MKLTKPSKAQIMALHRVRHHAVRGGTVMPYADEARSFEACERRGWLEYRSVDNGSPFNGYALTPAGRAALEEQS